MGANSSSGEQGERGVADGTEEIFGAEAGRRAALKDGRVRNIALFSDGTGNSSGKLQKTNVWRLYEALDLGYPATVGGNGETSPIQLAYYDDGVGTSSFKPLYFLGGIFGFGLARNVRELYMYLSRNYQENDRIYAFGFSRGAYTIRLLVALVAMMGVIEYTDEAQLRRQTLDLWREYRRGFHTNFHVTDLFVSIGRALYRLAIRIKRLITKQPQYADGLPGVRPPWWGREWYEYWFKKPAKVKPLGPSIAFVGVWDTVAAYGGPIVEITRAIDAWIWPLTMPNYRLSTKVQCARHALAIDDKRDSFHPLLWDEVHEESLEGYDRDNPRLQQVWFAGMHADVGGGYPDDFLSYVSLAWMVEHAEGAGLRLLERYRQNIFEVRNAFGPVHNSRGGMGAFYRYQPRYINAWLDYADPLEDGGHVRPGTRIYRDTTIDRGRYKMRGFLRAPIRLHHSVEERLLTATDGYAPNNLPGDYIVDDGVRGTLKSLSNNAAPLKDVYELGDRIKLRRFWYFISVLVVLVIVAKPLWDPWRISLTGGVVDVRTDTQTLSTALGAVLPSILGRWVSSFANDPYLSIVLFTLLGVTTARGFAQENHMVDASRRLWSHRFAPFDKKRIWSEAPAVGFARRAARRWRGSELLQDMLARLKWKLIPFMIGLLLWLALLYAALAVLTQVALVWQEVRPSQCSDVVRDGTRVPTVGHQLYSRTVPIDSPCIDLGAALASDTSYEVTVVMQGGAWRDGDVAASPEGWHHPSLLQSIMGQGSKFFRRVTTAPLFAPVFETRILKFKGEGLWYGDGAYMMRPELTASHDGCPFEVSDKSRRAMEAPACVWKGRIRTGTFAKFRSDQRRLFFFVNDAVAPIDWVSCPRNAQDCKGHFALFPLGGRYRNNVGQALVTVRAVDDEPPP